MEVKRRATILVIVSVLATSGVAMAASSVSYSGTTTQKGQSDGSVHFTVTSNPTAVEQFSGTMVAVCGQTQANITLNPSPDMKVKSHKFGFHGTFNIDNGTVVIAKKVDGKINGQFGHGGKVTGTMSFTWKFDSNAPQGFAGKHCTTGSVKFTANKR
jgi:hypothetical protein